MRLIKKIQRALREGKVSFRTGDELDEMAQILEGSPGIEGVYQSVMQDITGGEISETGCAGFDAERVVKLGILRKRLGLTYRALAEATADSLSVRRFLDLRPGEVLSRSAIHGNLKRVSEKSVRLFSQLL